MENENKKKNVTSNGSKKSAPKKGTKTSSSKNSSTKKTGTKKPVNNKVGNGKVESTKKTSTANKNGVKKNTTAKKNVPAKEKKVVKQEVKEEVVKEELTSKEKVEIIKKEKKVEVKEERVKTEEKIISTKTWFLTALCGLLIIVAIIAFSIINKFDKIEPTDYYVYVSEDKLMIWDRENEKGSVLSSTFLTEPNKEFNYANINYYVEDKERIYFIDNIVDKAFDLNYINVSDLNNKERKATRVLEQITSYKVSNGVIVYEKDSKLYVEGIEEAIAEKVTSYDMGKDGKNVYYIDANKTVHLYNVDKKTSTKVTENYDKELYVVDNDLYTIVENGYLFEIHKNGELYKENVTDFGMVEGEFIYVKYDDSLDKEFDRLTKEYEESKITFEDIKKIINTKERVLLFIGKPTCSFCTLLDDVFTEIKKDKDFSYVYVNTIFIDDAELSKLLKFGKVDETKFGTPTLIVTENGKAITSHIGYMEKEEATEFLETNKIFTSKFTYDNSNQVVFTPDVMHLASDTYIVENGKDKLLTKGIFYLTNTDYAFESNFKLSLDTKNVDFSTSSAADLNYDLTLNLTNKKGETLNSGLLVSELKAMYLDTRNDYLLYQTSDDEKANFAKIKNGKLKTKATIDTETLCNVTSTIRGTLFITDCNNYGFGKLKIWTGNKLKTVGENVYQVFDGTNKYTYYIKYDEEKETYLLYSYDKKEKLVSETYYAFQPTSDVFYIKENIKAITDEEGKTTNEYTYDLYILNEKNESVLVGEKIDTNFMALPIK